MQAKKNVIIFYTDQQRGDSLGCLGNALARTPHLDQLAQNGTLYTNHYAVNPVCVPSRAAFFTGRYPQANRVLDNGIPLPESEVTLAEVFRRNGYRTASFGKLHFQTYKSYPGDQSRESTARWARGEMDGWSGPYYGFEHVALTAGHGEGCGGAYRRWRDRHFPDLKLGAENAQGMIKFPALGAYKSNMPLEAHYNTWITQNAVDYLAQVGDDPFFMFVSFPDPHHPFTPPAPYHSLFDSVKFPEPHTVANENFLKPKPYREAMYGNPFPTDGGARFIPEFSGSAYQTVLAHTYGMISMVDDCMGQVLETLERKGMRQNTVIVFSADHGDFLGDHHFLYKGQLPCRSLLRIPLIIADPERQPGQVADVCSNIDVMPTLLAACGLEIPEAVQGEKLLRTDETNARGYAFEAGWSKASAEWQHYTIYTNNWRLTIFPRLSDGEMYHLDADPFEHRNLYHLPEFGSERHRLQELLLHAVGRAEPAKPPVVTDW
jgi:arylsulfatase A-like enzyme